MDADIQKAQRGDRDAMARLVDAQYDAVYRFCARRVDRESAQDMAQETFLTAQRSIKGFAQQSSFSTWLLGIAHNHIRNAYRKRKMEPIDWIDDQPGANPENALIDREALRKALRGLSDEHREVTLLHEIDGLTYEEAAHVLQIPVGWIADRLPRRLVLSGVTALGVVLSGLLAVLDIGGLPMQVLLLLYGPVGFSTYAIALMALGDLLAGAELIAANAALGLCWGAGALAGSYATGVLIDAMGANGFPLALGGAFLLQWVATLSLPLRRQAAR